MHFLGRAMGEVNGEQFSIAVSAISDSYLKRKNAR